MYFSHKTLYVVVRDVTRIISAIQAQNYSAFVSNAEFYCLPFGAKFS
jgi:hypothetical protein